MQVWRLTSRTAAILFTVCGVSFAGGERAMHVKRVTTTILTHDVDACAAFWTERLEFEQTLSVPAQQPGETGNQFVAVSNDRHELMFQSFKSTDDELPGMFAPADKGSFMLYVEVSDLDGAIARMKDLEPVVSRRTTFYGSEEIGYADPCGTLVILAEFPEATDEATPDGGRP